MSGYLRTPGQSSSNFRLGTPSATRPKGLFFVTFRRPHIDGSDDIRGDDFGFVVKNLDQPKISIKTEELSQYNKKRQIHTGYDISPITITLFDTNDGVARQLWQNYLGHHFGDFRHDVEGKDWAPDQINAEMMNWKTGYGLVLPEEDAVESDRYFFHSVDIYQIYGSVYTRISLINPRIISFDPDDLDYEDLSPSTFRMQITYETLTFTESSPLSDNNELWNIFGSSQMGGDPLNLPDTDSTSSLIEKALGNIPGSSTLNSVLDIFGADNILDSLPIFGPEQARSGTGGVLGVLGGGFNFGGRGVLTENGGGGFGSFANSIEQALSAVGLGTSANPLVGALGQLAGGIATASRATNTAPRQHAEKTSAGLSLSPEALAVVNSQRPATSQYGKRS